MANKKNIAIAGLLKGNSRVALKSIGQKYGQLYVIYYAGDVTYENNKGKRDSIIIAQCDCGSINTYRYTHLKYGLTKSCGCFQSKSSSLNHTTHGHKRGKSVGGRGSLAYSRWRSMIDRCSKDIRYLQGNIKICDEWLLFHNFLADMGEPPTEKHTLDRRENDKGYYKENCRWATAKEQANNTTRNVRITVGGKKYTLSQAMNELGFGKRKAQSYSAIQNNKTYHGLSVEVISKYKKELALQNDLYA